jgi:DNA-binding winged helix-turn-helix (wHTH) protein
LAVRRITASFRATATDSGKVQHLIRTIARKGFRFVGEVREASDVPSVRIAQTTASAAKLVGLDDDASTGVREKSDRDVVTQERKLVTVLCADVKQPLELIGT